MITDLKSPGGAVADAPAVPSPAADAASITPPLRALSADMLTIDDLVHQAAHVAAVLAEVRGDILSPDRRKHPPVFTSPAVMDILGMDAKTFQRRLDSGKFPPAARIAGKGRAGAERRLHSVEDVRAMFRSEGLAMRRAEGALAPIICFANSKGGVGKTTTAVVMAQRAALTGRDVLLVDLDPQGSATNFAGFLPEAEVSADETMLVTLPDFTAPTGAPPVAAASIVRQTYWPGLDLIPAGVHLEGAQSRLSMWEAMRPSEASLAYLAVLQALAPLRDKYDLIVIDTPPAVSTLTLNALLAANGIVVPVGATPVDFAASSGFWSQFTDHVPEFRNAASDAEAIGISLNQAFAKSPVAVELARQKVYDFVRMVVNRSSSHPITEMFRTWVSAGYGAKVAPVEIPDSRATDVSSALLFGTVFDSTEQSYEGDSRTYRRVREAYDSLGQYIDGLLAAMAARRASKGGSA